MFLIFPSIVNVLFHLKTQSSFPHSKISLYPTKIQRGVEQIWSMNHNLLTCRAIVETCG